MEHLRSKKNQNRGEGFGTRWLGLNVPWGDYGIHGTNKPELIGKNVSSGCIRMRNEDVEALYDLIPNGTIVHIDGPVTGMGKGEFKNLSLGSKGNLVQLVQNRLKAIGLFHGAVDGNFNKQTENAVKSFQKINNLPTDRWYYPSGIYVIGNIRMNIQWIIIIYKKKQIHIRICFFLKSYCFFISTTKRAQCFISKVLFTMINASSCAHILNMSTRNRTFISHTICMSQLTIY